MYHTFSVHTISDIANEHVLEHDGARWPIQVKVLIIRVQYCLGLYAPYL